MLFRATIVATAPNDDRILSNGGSIFPNGVRIFPNGGSIFQNGGSIFSNGGSISRPSLRAACSYKSSSKKHLVATSNLLFISPFSTKVALVALFSSAYYAHTREERSSNVND